MALNRPRDKPSAFPTFITLSFHNPLLFILCFILWLFTLLFLFSSPPPLPPENSQCPPDIAPFFIVPIPPRFNSDLLRRCRSLNPYTDMCPHVANAGLGRLISPSWHATHQFLAELIFLAAASRHPCRTHDSSASSLFLLPFYAGLYASSQFSQPNLTLRDSLALDFASLLPLLPSWPRRHGRDHFLVLGRTSWDFMRSPASSDDFGANPLLLLPAVQNLSVLTVERHPWQGRHQFGIPYPSYFHPSAADELAAWQAEVLASHRTHLFAFVGGARPPELEKAAARAEILRQCGASRRCLQVLCRPGSAADSCYEPDRVLSVLRRANFCMQPPGDSFTRRSVFDAVLAGCVPVFFSEHTAYTQYGWYEPAHPEEWSVLLEPDRWGRIEEELDRIPRPVLDRMRARVVEMIPRVTYAHPNASRGQLGFRDAVDVALAGLTKTVRSAGPEA
ncbi:Xyloglucan galactosyltransferase KATAMARI1 like [Apostasia shenzhenica]|uniref:Xyloglucan galactosyltransferase KATAMARI1 like n=1 Tax=Apostasia shenzhenica TaxID=1088818 RepID=A0A2I0B0B5_9ASPA|nr:Xyloglucan galactosyltransferase KATAMARI1 like [Apostasia shenzhenica]